MSWQVIRNGAIFLSAEFIDTMVELNADLYGMKVRSATLVSGVQLLCSKVGTKFGVCRRRTRATASATTRRAASQRGLSRSSMSTSSSTRPTAPPRYRCSRASGMYVYMYICMHACMYVCAHTRARTHTHTHTHKNILPNIRLRLYTYII